MLVQHQHAYAQQMIPAIKQTGFGLAACHRCIRRRFIRLGLPKPKNPPCGFQSSNAFLLISRVTLVDLLDGLEVGLLSGRGDCSFSICGLAKLPQAKTRSHSVGLGQAN